VLTIQGGMMRQVRAPWLRVTIEGLSMIPTLAPGEWWIARRTSVIRSGDLVVLEHPVFPGIIAVKRAIRQTEDGWWVEGDNPQVSTDSRDFGPVPSDHLLGVLWIRYRPAPWRRSRGGGRHD